MSDSAGVVREMDCDRLRQQARTATPFPYVLIDDFLDPDFAHEALRSWPSYKEAAEIGREFHSLNERRKVEVTNSATFPPALRNLNEALASSKFVNAVSTIFEIPDLVPDAELVGGGLHQTGPRGLLDVHVDFNYLEARRLYRRLNILIYFNAGWRTEWGGHVELWNRDVSKCIRSFDPVFNRCVIFETSEISFHGVTEVVCPADVVRRSFAGYYYTHTPPPLWAGQSHSTIFKARPTESLKSTAMTVQRASAHAKGAIKRAVRGSAALSSLEKAVRRKS